MLSSSLNLEKFKKSKKTIGRNSYPFPRISINKQGVMTLSSKLSKKLEDCNSVEFLLDRSKKIIVFSFLKSPVSHLSFPIRKLRGKNGKIYICQISASQVLKSLNYDYTKNTPVKSYKVFQTEISTYEGEKKLLAINLTEEL